MVGDHHKGMNDSWATERFGCSRTAYINVFEDKCGYQKRGAGNDRQIYHVSQQGPEGETEARTCPHEPPCPLDRTDCIAEGAQAVSLRH